MKKILFFLLLVMHSYPILSQNLRIDSLEKQSGIAIGTDKVKILTSIADYYSVNDAAMSIDAYNKAIIFARLINDKLGEANALVHLSDRISQSQSSHAAIDTLVKALDIYLKLNMKIEIALTRSLIGKNYYEAGNFDKAFEHYYKAMQAIDENNIIEVSIKYKTQNSYEQDSIKKELNIASLVFNDYALLCINVEKYTEALEYFNRSLIIARNVNNKTRIAGCLTNIGLVYNAQKNYEKALQYYLMGKDIAKEINNLDYYSKSLLNIGNIYNELGDYQSAYLYFLEAKPIFEKIQNYKGMVNILINLGMINKKLKNYSDAKDYYFQALDYSYSKDFSDLIPNILLDLSNIYELEKNYPTALDYFKKYSEVKDSLTKVNESRHIEELQIKFKTDTQQKEIEYLKKIKDNQENDANILMVFALIAIIIAIVALISYLSKRRTNFKLNVTNQKLIKSEKELKELNATKDKFFSIISHDLKNPINVYIDVLDLILNNYDDIPDDEKLEFLGDLLSNSKNLKDLLENLLQWSKAQLGSIKFNPESIDLTYLANNTISLLHGMTNSKNINVQNKIQPETKIFGDVNMVSTILRNLISNAIKFTHEGGTITVASKPNNGMTEISVIDSGIGMSKEDMDKLFNIDSHHTTEGTQHEKGTGLGLLLCKEFVEMNGGKIKISSEPGKGSTFTFSISSEEKSGNN